MQWVARAQIRLVDGFSRRIETLCSMPRVVETGRLSRYVPEPSFHGQRLPNAACVVASQQESSLPRGGSTRTHYRHRKRSTGGTALYGQLCETEKPPFQIPQLSAACCRPRA